MAVFTMVGTTVNAQSNPYCALRNLFTSAHYSRIFDFLNDQGANYIIHFVTVREPSRNYEMVCRPYLIMDEEYMVMYRLMYNRWLHKADNINFDLPTWE